MTSVPDQIDPLPRSPLRVMHVVEALAGRPGGMRLAELSAHLSIPKTSLLSQLRALSSEDYVIHNDSTYEIGPAAIRIAMVIQCSYGGLEQVRRTVANLAQDSGETAILGQVVSTPGEAAYISVIEGTQSLRYSPPVGTRRPLLFTAIGRALLAFQDAEFIRRALDGRILPHTPRTITDRAELEARLQRIRKSGVAITEGELVEDLGAIAAPIFDRTGRVVFSIGVALPLNRLEVKRDALTPLVKAAANEASYALGGRGL